MLQEFCQNLVKQYYFPDPQCEASEQQNDLSFQLKTNPPNQSLEFSTVSMTHHSSGSDVSIVPDLL